MSLALSSPLRFASEAWPRAGLGEPRSASNANKPASSWPLKQGRKKCSKHGCDRETSTVASGLVTHKEKRYVLTFMFKLLARKSVCKTFAGSNEILRWLTPFLGPNMDPKRSRIGSPFIPSFRFLLGPRFGVQIWTQKWGQPSEIFAAARRCFASRFATH